jgi:hypothetical protein
MRWDDPLGPVVLVTFLVTALSIQFIIYLIQVIKAMKAANYTGLQ